MKLLMLVKDLNVKTLNTGDKSARITLETLFPENIEELIKLANKTEVAVEFERSIEYSTEELEKTENQE